MMPELIDHATLFQYLFVAAHPEYNFAIELSEASIDELPLVVHKFIGDGQSQNGPGLWPGSLIVSVLADGAVEAAAVAKAIYATVWSWAAPGNGLVPNEGVVESVEDESLFSAATSSDVIGKNVSQLDGSFGVALRTIY